MSNKVIAIGLLFVFIIVSGLWLSSGGRPLSSLRLTVHKLLGVGALVLMIMVFRELNQESKLSSAEMSGAILALIFFLSTIVTGGLLSIDKSMPTVVERLHQVFPVLTVISSSGILVVLLSRE